MSYGLYDGDLYRYKEVPFFNLELMKLSTYYKRKREIITFAPNFVPQMYTHFLVRQDYPSHTPYSSKYTNVEYGGRAFDGNNYKPLPEEVERMKADTDLYNKLESNYGKSYFSTMRRAEHLRLSLDGKTIWPDWEKQIRKTPNTFGIILHDYDLGAIDGACELIKNNLDIVNYSFGRRIGMKYPVQINTEQDLYNWLEIPPLNKYYSVQYNDIIDFENFDKLAELRINSTSLPQTSMNVTANIGYEEFITTGIVRMFKSILDLRTRGLNFSLIYDKNFFTDYHWAEVLNLIQLFNNHIGTSMKKNYRQRVAPYETLYSYARNCTKNYGHVTTLLKREQAISVFQFVRENNYDLFTLFYEYTGEHR